MKSAILKSAITLAVSALFLTACGGDSTGLRAQAATSASTGAATAAGLAATAGKTFSFPAGVLGTAPNPTDLSFSTTAAGTGFSLASGGFTATGRETTGSCIFEVLTSNFPQPHPTMFVGNKITIAACNLNAATAGQLANGSPVTQNVTLDLGGVVSGPVTLPVTISPSGAVSVGGVVLGTVALVTPTGA